MTKLRYFLESSVTRLRYFLDASVTKLRYFFRVQCDKIALFFRVQCDKIALFLKVLVKTFLAKVAKLFITFLAFLKNVFFRVFGQLLKNWATFNYIWSQCLCPVFDRTFYLLSRHIGNFVGSQYAFRFVNYDRRAFIRLATLAFTLPPQV